MGFEEPRVLANDVHNIRCNDSFVVLAALDLAETKQVLDDGDQEAFLSLFVCGIVRTVREPPSHVSRTHSTRNRTNSPAKSIKVLP